MADKKVERQLNLISYLLAEREPLPINRIFEDVSGYISDKDHETKRRMFERDKTDLKELGFNIQYREEGVFQDGGYFLNKKDVFLPDTHFTPEEKFIISRLICASLKESSFSLYDCLSSAAQKLGFFTEHIHVDTSFSRIGPFFLHTDSLQDRKVLPDILDAISMRKNIKVNYKTSYRKEARQRTISPYAVILRSSYWYIVGFCHLRNEVRVFRIDRIIAPVQFNKTPGKKEFEIPEDFKTEDYSSERWDFSSDDGKDAVVKFTKEIAGRIEKVLPDGSAVKHLKNGDIEVTFKSVDINRFGWWISTFGRHALAIKPKDFRKLVFNKVKAVRDIYAEA